MSHRLLMLGLDGVGADILSRLSEEGITPNMARLARDGAFGPLRATVPPITGPSWLGLSTGLDVDQTGIADFLVRRPPLFDLRPIGSRDFRGRAIWDLVGAAGLRTCVFNFPILFPPYDANGIMVSGFGTDESTQWTSPASLKSELIDVVGRDYNLAVNYHSEHYDDVPRFLDDLEASVDRRVQAAEWLLQREPWDLAVCIFSETDWLMHRCWDVLDPDRSNASPPEARALASRARSVFTRLDAAVPRLLDAMGSGASLLVCSDHGFGSNTCTMKLNASLERAGLLVRRRASQRGSAVIRRAGIRVAQRAGAAAAQVRGPIGRSLAQIRRRARRLLPKDDSAYLSTIIDPAASAMLDPGHTIPFGGLYVGSSIERGSPEYDATIARVEEHLAETAAAAGYELDLRRPWKAAAGHLETLPDLLVSGDSWGMTFSKTDFEGPLVVDGPFSRRHTGSHRIEGMYLASGPLLDAQSHEPASVLDIAPTVLAFFGLAAPVDMHGSILRAFRGAIDDLQSTKRIESVDADGSSSDDDADVRERLRGLGYIE